MRGKKLTERRGVRRTTHSIVTDVQFWVPVGILCFGLALLIALH